MLTPFHSLVAGLTLARMDEEVAIIITAAIAGCVIVAIVHSIRRTLETRERERTKREVAAYVAEGSISPGDARALLSTDGTALEKSIADAVAWGTISADKAEKLIRSARAAPTAPASPEKA